MAELEIDYAGLDSPAYSGHLQGYWERRYIISCALKCHIIASQYLCVMYKLSLDTGLVPKDWKTPYVVPMHKAGSKKKTCTKLLSHILNFQLLQMIRANY